MRLLITGSTGFIGSYVVREALERGHEVITMIHKTEMPEGFSDSARTRSIRFELGCSERLDLRSHALDAVIHLAGSLSDNRERSRRIIVDGSRQIVDAAKQAGIKKIVCVSSIAVIDYAAIPEMSLIDESAPTVDYRSGKDSYAELKAEQETVMEPFCADPNAGLVMLRPGLVYDGSRLSTAHAGIVRKSMSLLASHAGRVPLIEAGNLAGAIIDAVELQMEGKEILHLVDDALPSQENYLGQLQSRGLIGAAKLTVPWNLYYIGTALCRIIFKLPGLRHRIPELFTRPGFAARLKPFRFANDRARALLKRDFAGEF